MGFSHICRKQKIEVFTRKSVPLGLYADIDKFNPNEYTLDYDKFPSILNDYDITYGNE